MTKTRPHADQRVFDLGVPVLGICYGLQFMVHALGGKVRAADKREYGHAEVEMSGDSGLFRGLPKELSVWMSHGDEAVELPAGFQADREVSERGGGHRKREQKMWAVQFHPEVHHTPLGTEILRNFALEDLRCETDLDGAALYRCDRCEGPRRQVGQRPRHLRAFRWSGFRGGRGAGGSGHARRRQNRA